jgi:hypothetical protein
LPSEFLCHTDYIVEELVPVFLRAGYPGVGVFEVMDGCRGGIGGGGLHLTLEFFQLFFEPIPILLQLLNGFPVGARPLGKQFPVHVVHSLLKSALVGAQFFHVVDFFLMRRFCRSSFLGVQVFLDVHHDGAHGEQEFVIVLTLEKFQGCPGNGIRRLALQKFDVSVTKITYLFESANITFEWRGVELFKGRLVASVLLIDDTDVVPDVLNHAARGKT